MLRKFLLALSLSSLAFLAALSLGCGSSSPTTQTCTGTFTILGNWQITVSDTGGGQVTGYGAIDSSGLALFFDANAQAGGTGDTIQLPVLTGACSYAGNVIAYSEPGGPNSGTIITDTISGNVNSSTSVTGSFSGVSTGTISLSPFTPLSGTVAALSGSKTGEVQGAFNLQPIFMSLTVTPSGTGAGMTFTGTDGLNCTGSGSFTQQGSANVFDVSITFAGASCPIVGTMTGLGFESSTDYFFGNSGGTYLYADILNSSNTFVMEIF